MSLSMSWKGAQAKAAARKGVERGLALGAEHVLEESSRLVPLEEATLQRSGSTDVDGTTASVSYDTPYAVVQHEDLSLAHDAGRTAKYLEKPMMSEKDVVGKIVQREVAREIKGGLGGLI